MVLTRIVQEAWPATQISVGKHLTRVTSRIQPTHACFRFPASPLARREYSTSSTRNSVFPARTVELVAKAKSVSLIPPSERGIPEIIVTGRANVGKSSLLNALIGRQSFVSTSKKAGHTRSLDFYRVGKGKGELMLVDAPGYGSRGRPEWGHLFDTFIQSRPSLVRVYILLNAKHGVKESDIAMLTHLNELMLDNNGAQRWSIQAVLTKLDEVRAEDAAAVVQSVRADVEKACPLCMPALPTSTTMTPPFGIDHLRGNILQACGLS